MIWNTIAHPKMMSRSNDGASPTPGPTPGNGSGVTPFTPPTLTPIKFADMHKLSFYDIIVSTVRTGDSIAPILVKGDFETIKCMILNGEAVCGAIFTSVHDGSVFEQNRVDFVNVEYISLANTIAFTATDADLSMVLLLHSDNTLTSESSATDIGDIGPRDPGSDTEQPGMSQ